MRNFKIIFILLRIDLIKVGISLVIFPKVNNISENLLCIFTF
jgi:hypothetical protein